MSKGKRSKHPTFDSRDSLLDAPVDDELDLHGYSAAEAPAAVRAFLERWQRRKAGAVVSIVTGKGNRSANGPVLRGLVKNLLERECRVIVRDWRLDDGEGGYRVSLR
ncbi:MAG TPA: Smr/MutS family protein [Gemmatimonadales bacterium]|nr:Smr/MutS family protein [Gemmatimonadales bacterium]